MVKKEPCRVQGFFTFWGFCPGFVFWRYQRACVAACSLISSSWSFIESQCMVTGVSTAFNATGGRLFSLKKARNSSSCWLEKPFRTIISSWKFCPRLNTGFFANPGISNKIQGSPGTLTVAPSAGKSSVCSNICGSGAGGFHL